MNTNQFNYQNTEVKMTGGARIVRKVSIKNGKGYKSVTKYHKGRKIYTNKKPIHNDHVGLIKIGKFIPGLFKGLSSKTRKR